MSKRTPEGVTLRCFRFALDLTEEELGAPSGTSGHLISRWELGKTLLSPDRLVQILEPHGVPPEAVEQVLVPLRLLLQPPQDRPSPVDPGPEERRLIHRAAVAVAGSVGQRMAGVLIAQARRRRARQAREWAARKWEHMKGLTREDQLRFLDSLQDERMWALVERLCYASEAAAAHRADKALALAELAVYAAERMLEPEDLRLQAQGFAWGFLANAKRVAGNLPEAREAFRISDRLWKAGEPGHGLFDGSRLLDLKASLLKHDGRLEEAAALLEQALAGSRSQEARGRILLKQAALHARGGDYERAIERLRQAASQVDAEREPRLACVQLFNRAFYLCNLERFTEAQELVPRVRQLVVKLANELDLVRLLGLDGKIKAGLRLYDEAKADFAQARRYFEEQRIAFDYALMSLELALVHLEQRSRAEVAKLADEMWWIFQAQGVHEEALAALRLFCEAARREEAEAAWVRRVLDYLYRSQEDPTLRFEQGA